MKIGRPIALLLIILLLIVGTFVSLMSNYASGTKLPVFEKNPALPWVLLVFGVVALIALSVWQYKIDNLAGSVKRTKKNGANTVMGNNKYDVFVSYSHDDQDWVQSTLVPKLKSRGFATVTDQNMKAGEIQTHFMRDSVVNSRHTIVVLTPSYLQSKWTTFETAMAQTIDPDAQMRKLIPVLRKDCDIPLNIVIYHYRDLRHDDANEWEHLIEDLI